MLSRAGFPGPSKWRFNSLPTRLYCRDCGIIKTDSSECEFPIRAVPVGMFKLTLVVTFIIGSLIVLFILGKNFCVR